MVTASSPRTLPFDNGDVMTREEFHRLYSECEEFPGLRLNVHAMLAQDREAVRA